MATDLMKTIAFILPVMLLALSRGVSAEEVTRKSEVRLAIEKAIAMEAELTSRTNASAAFVPMPEEKSLPFHDLKDATLAGRTWECISRYEDASTLIATLETMVDHRIVMRSHPDCGMARNDVSGTWKLVDDRIVMTFMVGNDQAISLTNEVRVYRDKPAIRYGRPENKEHPERPFGYIFFELKQESAVKDELPR